MAATATVMGRTQNPVPEVYWSLWSECLPTGSSKLRFALVLELAATHSPIASHSPPNCPGCRRVGRNFHRIARALLRSKRAGGFCKLEAYDQTIRYSERPVEKPEVALTIRLLHKDGFEACRGNCLSEIQRRLRDMGLRERARDLREERAS